MRFLSLTRLFLLSIILFSYHNFSFATELVTDQAIKYYEEGVQAQKSSNFELADINYNKTLLLDPYNLNWKKYIFNNRGAMYAKMGNFDLAEQYFNEALKIDPGYRPAQLNLGIIIDRRLSRLESLEYWLKALDINIDEIKPKDFVVDDQPETE